MSIKSEITRIQNAKNDITNALVEQGVSVPSVMSLDDVGDLIRQIGSNITSGSWTPTSEFLSSVAVANGSYIRVDDFVVISFYLQGTCDDSGSNFTIGGLPFAVNTQSKWYAGGGHCQGLSFTSADNVYFTGWMIDSSKQLIYGRGSKSVAASTSMSGEYLKAKPTATVYLSGTLMYKIA